jgi:hypothetical protein
VLPSSFATDSAYPIEIFEAQYPAHRCRCLRFTNRLAATRAKLAVRMESLPPFLQDSFIPNFMPVYPGAPQDSSGGKQQRGPISKQRNAHLQVALVEAAKLAPRHNPQLAALREREIQRGSRNRATLAVARKLVAYLMAVDRWGRPFALPADGNAAQHSVGTTAGA